MASSPDTDPKHGAAWLRDAADADRLKDLSARYPYFPLPALTLLHDHDDTLSGAERDGLRTHTALVNSDKKAVFELLSERKDDFASIYPPAVPDAPASTDSALDTFFANYGTASEAETKLLERMIFNPTPDYAELLLREEADSLPDLPSCPPAMTGADDTTVMTAAPGASPTAPASAATAPPAPSVKPPAADNPDDSLLSESLAKIFVKQGRYRRAYEIISNLSLNYPKKSIYFADQLRFLQKLIEIQELQPPTNE